jgi:6-phospho-beta-glucosidase
MTRLTVIGGSTPFVIDLIDALAERGGPPPSELKLHGRNLEALRLVERYSRGRLEHLGWTVDATTDLPRALDGAEIVVHQVRYGGLAGRQADERLAEHFGVPADETLGPGGLQSGLRAAKHLSTMAAALSTWCPHAWTLNLTNPLSCSTAVLSTSGVERVIGVCELPQSTRDELCAQLEILPSAVGWEYSGLNHRGFVHTVRYQSRDLLAEFCERYPDRSIGGITADEIDALGALPVKHFALARATVPAGRGAFLERVRRSALQQLRANGTARPSAITMRDQPWYEEAVVPTIEALQGGRTLRTPVNLVCEGIARETMARISSAGVQPEPSPSPSDPVSRWVERFEEHERFVAAAVHDPSVTSIAAAIKADPLVHTPEPLRAAQMILDEVHSTTW